MQTHPGRAIRTTTVERVEGATLTRTSRVLVGNCEYGSVRGERRGEDLGAWLHGEHTTNDMPDYVKDHDEALEWLGWRVAEELAAQWEAWAS